MRTMELKSAWSDSTAPDTWLPTWTVVTAWSVPVAETTLTMSPRRDRRGRQRGRRFGAGRVVGAGPDRNGNDEPDWRESFAFHTSEYDPFVAEPWLRHDNSMTAPNAVTAR